MTTSGWGVGEWNDMAWGSGLDYVYAPTVFLDAEGPYITSRAAKGRLVAFTASSRQPSFAAIGRYPPLLVASGKMVTRAASGALKSYHATGVIEHGN